MKPAEAPGARILAEMLQQATGLSVPLDPIVAAVLAVEVIDSEVPADMTVMQFGPAGRRIWTVGPLVGRIT